MGAHTIEDLDLQSLIQALRAWAAGEDPNAAMMPLSAVVARSVINSIAVLVAGIVLHRLNTSVWQEPVGTYLLVAAPIVGLVTFIRLFSATGV